jgi:hypothetical protein
MHLFNKYLNVYLCKKQFFFTTKEFGSQMCFLVKNFVFCIEKH